MNFPALSVPIIFPHFPCSFQVKVTGMNFLTNSLPNYEGKYNVGFVDIEATPKQFDKPAVLARVFYPTDNGHAKGSNWLPNNWSYAFGYGNFLHIPSAAIALILYPVLTLTRKRHH